MSTHEAQTLSAEEICGMLRGRLCGEASATIESVETLELANPRQLSFVGDVKQLSRLRRCAAGIVIVPDSAQELLAEFSDRSLILVPDPESAFLLVAEVLHPRRPRLMLGVSDQAFVSDSARIGANTNVHPGANIGRDVVIGRNSDIHPGVVIGDDCVIGDHVVIHPNTVLYAGVQVGSNVVIHAGCVIGCDGFGYRTVNGRHEHLPHLGSVCIEDDVEIGACTTIDRAKVGNTVIGTGTRIDNQVMIAHNCRIGRHNLLVSQVGFAGSCTTGDYVVCAGQAGIADHVHLGDGAIIGAQAGVHRSLPGSQRYFGTPAGPLEETTRQHAAIKRLPALRDTVRQLERELATLRQQFDDTSDSMPEADAA